MKLYVANPIYDSVFKYLMEDERIARTLLSALLKTEVVKVEHRPHEYANTARNEISMFRIDFGATILDKDRKERLVLIELQKTWLETETLRFRQYLGSQYSRKENIVESDKARYALPMIAVYLLGHRVGEIEEPVLYVNHKSYDYDGNEVTKGIPDPFVESLTHNSIIVQIPLLRGRVNNRLETVLSVFDQSNISDKSRQIIAVEEDRFVGDVEMEYLLHRLLSAASDPEMRQNMNVEDEFFQAIEDRDTALMHRNKLIKEQEQAIKEQKQAIKEQKRAIKEQEQTIDKQEQAIKEQEQTIDKQVQAIKEQEQTIDDQRLMLTNAIKMMQNNGMSLQDIARTLEKSEEEIAMLLQIE